MISRKIEIHRIDDLGSQNIYGNISNKSKLKLYISFQLQCNKAELNENPCEHPLISTQK